MKPSISFLLTKLIIRIKGIKKKFSQDPIDFKKIRREDIHQPKGRFFTNKNVSRITILNSTITEFAQQPASNKLLLFVHGGAFISGPTDLHWQAVKKIYKGIKHTIWMCDYPKAPESNIIEISENLDHIYQRALENFEAKDITFIGDSVGGTLLSALTQRLIKNNREIPNKLILISPVMDAGFSNPEIKEIDPLDLLLSKKGVLSAKRLCAVDNDLTDVRISPINGSFEKFPSTVLFLAEHDITYPDQKIAVQKLKSANIKVKVYLGSNMPHIWPYLPIMSEASESLNDVIKNINE